MNARRVLGWLSGTFLVIGLIGVALHALEPYPTNLPAVSLTFVVLGTAGVAFLAYLGKTGSGP